MDIGRMVMERIRRMGGWKRSRVMRTALMGGVRVTLRVDGPRLWLRRVFVAGELRGLVRSMLL